MSGEFGHGTMFFHEHIDEAASIACNEGDYEITKLFGKLLKDLSVIAHSISWAEASDTSQEQLILTCIKSVDRLQTNLDDIKKYLSLYENVIQESIRVNLDKK